MGGGVRLGGAAGLAPGAVHLPAGMAGAGGVHLPSSIGGGVRPSGVGPAGVGLGGVGSGVHLPGSMVAGGSRPGAMGLAHVPGSVLAPRPGGLAPTRGPAFAVREPPAVARPGEAIERRPAGSEALRGLPEGAGLRHGPGFGPGLQRAAFRPPVIVPRDPMRDPRLGRDPGRAIPGLAAGYAVARPTRPYLRLPEHRDLAADRAFVDRHAGDFHSRLARDMDGRERALWRAGLWRNEWHYGRRGWWWEADGAWYPYADPVWPYPPAVAALVVYEAATIDGASLTPAEQGPDGPARLGSAGDGSGGPGLAPAAPAEPAGEDPRGGRPAGAPVALAAADVPPLPAAPSGWYRCGAPDGYYPGESACGPGWQLVQTPPLPGE